MVNVLKERVNSVGVMVGESDRAGFGFGEGGRRGDEGEVRVVGGRVGSEDCEVGVEGGVEESAG